MKKIFFITLFFCFTILLFAQENDSIKLNVNIDSVTTYGYKKISNNNFIYDIDINQKFSFHSLDKLLETNATIRLKKYGEGQISTISIKGFNASHTNVLWNGVKVNSPMLGQADLSIISLGNDTELSFSEENNDNIAGSISLINTIDFEKEKELQIFSSIGSFGSFNLGTSLAFSLKHKFYSNSNISFSYNLNKYKYRNKSLPYTEDIYLENGETQVFNFEQINALRFKKNNSLNIFLKAFFADRNIAPTIYESASSKKQKDNLYIAKIEWKKFAEKYSIKISNAFIYQKLNYRLSKFSNELISFSNSYQTNIELNTEISKAINFELNINNNIENGNTNNYSKSIWRNNLLLKANLNYKITKNIQAKTSFTEIFIDTKKFSQLLPNIELTFAKYNLPANFSFLVSYARKVKFPSLNDLYWNPGGNIDLKEEYSHNYNVNISLKRKFQKIEFSNHFEWFNILSENYILWQPSENTYWTPINIGAVFSRGFTNNLDFNYLAHKNFSLQNNFSFNYTKTSKLKEQEQLIYVPIASIYNSTKINSKWLNLYINQHYISKNYTSYDNLLYLNAYYLLDLIVAKEITFKNKNKLIISFEANNVLNTSYFTYINRALPKRNYFFKFKYLLK